MSAERWGWLGFALSVSGVAVQALIPAHLRWSFVIFAVANVLWFVNGVRTRNRPLAWKQAVLGALNCVSLIHWFG